MVLASKSVFQIITNKQHVLIEHFVVFPKITLHIVTYSVENRCRNNYINLMLKLSLMTRH